MGVTTHNPSTLVFPATMTNMRSGTIMMSGCGILTNGKGTRREYGDFNLDELNEGDRVGMMRKPNGDLHYFINGSDQGVAAQRVPSSTWGVIDLYGMTIKVSIVERDEREEHNLNMRRSTRVEEQVYPVIDTQPVSDYYDRLTFHPNCGAHAQVINNGKTALRPNAADDFNNGVVLTSRPLKLGELFEVRLERVVTKWAGSIEIGVTTHSPTDLEFPFTMTNVRSGTWMMTGSGIMHNGTTVLEQYGVNLDRLQVGDRVGVVRKESGLLHFFVNGVDQGTAATNVAERVYGVIDLYGQAVEAAIVDMFDCNSPDTIHSSLSNTTLYRSIIPVKNSICLTEAEMRAFLEASSSEDEVGGEEDDLDLDEDINILQSDLDSGTEVESFETDNEVDSESDNEKITHGDFYLGKNKSTKWQKKPVVSKFAKTSSKNLVKILPRPNRCAMNITNEFDAFQKFFTNEMIDGIVLNTNKFIASIQPNYSRE